jgi:hypothetical protein
MTEHLVVSRVVRQEETQVGVTQDSGDSDETSTATRNDGNVLPSVQAALTLAMMLVVQVGNSLSQWLDTGGRAILSGSNRDVDACGTLKTPLNVIFDFRGTLTQVGPLVGFLEEAILRGPLRAPDYTCGRSAGVKSGMGLVALVRVTELAMDL